MSCTDACTCAPRPRLWWVTDASRLRKKDEQKGDEDGPTSSEEAQDEGERKPDDALTSDSDPDSSRSDRGESQSQQAVVLPVRYDTRPPCDPSVQWAKTHATAVLVRHPVSLPPRFPSHACVFNRMFGADMSARPRLVRVVELSVVRTPE